MRAAGLLVAVAVMCAGCATAPIRPQDQIQLDLAAARVAEGCYDCLIEARDIYERVGVGRARPMVLPRLFETEVLIALRERELAIDSSAAEARASGRAAELTGVLDVARIMALVELVPPDPYGTPRRVASERARAGAARGALGTLEADIAWLAESGLNETARRYLALALYCGHSRSARVPYPVFLQSLPALQGADPDVPVALIYRAGICQNTRSSTLLRVQGEVPRFVETSYFLGRLAVATVQQRGNVADARETIEAAYARFPGSPSVTHLNGFFHQVIGDCRAALRFHAETIRLQPRHEDAWLGRTRCLTFLRQAEDAIAAATRLIDLPTDPLVDADAYYWRAWNRWSQKDLDLARSDIEAAKGLRSNPEIHTLAGQIEHDQDELDAAEDDLRTAIAMSFGKKNCTADWYLGLVLMKKERWSDTAAAFEQAMTCYDARVADSEAGLAGIHAMPDLDPDFRDRQIAGFEAAIVEDRSQYHAAAFNAANHYARAGNVEAARRLVEVAAADPALADLVGQLRAIIKVP